MEKNKSVNYELAQAYIAALTGSPDSIIDFRCIHDREKGIPAHTYRGTLREMWETLCNYNSAGYGIFCNINALDGVGREIANVSYIRTHVVDLDNTLTSEANYQRAVNTYPYPTFGVQTSPGKFHIYWVVEPYTGNEFYNIHQRKLRQIYDGDKSIIDPTRVLRVPGFYHNKGEPHLITCWNISGQRTTAAELQRTLETVNVFDNYTSRHPLGEPEMAAPSLDWLRFALHLIDPNEMDRGEWLSFSAAFKQAGWNHADEPTLLKMWQEWCNRYSGNDEPENLKLWNSIRDTEVGWPSIERRTTIRAYIDFGHREPPIDMTKLQQQSVAPQLPDSIANPVTERPVNYGEILSEYECQTYFKNCFFVEREGKIFTPSGRFMDSTKFNGKYGGKVFIITSTGKTTDEAWKAALRSTCWTIPKVDHVRFLPEKKLFEIVKDDMGRPGLNTYIPSEVKMKQGDVSIFLNHLGKILPDRNDQKILLDYMAHAIKYPGFKIPWSPMLQSAEGVGKTVFFEILSHSLGDMYVYKPKAPELVKSGSTFNAWMRGKLMIVVDEIKIDERRELIEILKPMITDSRVEVQSKGVDQDMEDNPANWLFHSNYKDAIPINQNGRRYAIFYSALQSAADILAAGMDDAYFNNFWSWLREGGGYEAIAYFFKNYPIERGGIPVRAPKTSSYEEALRVTRSPMEAVIADCVDDGLPGFRGGYVSALAVLARVKAAGIRQPSTRSIQSCLEHMGYVELGRCPRPYSQEDVNNRAIIYGTLSTLNINEYGKAQGYE